MAMDWYVLFVKSGQETLVQRWVKHFFESSHCHTLVPRRKLIERRQGEVTQVTRMLFPGYVFLHTDMSIESYYILKDIPGMLKILREDEGVYYSKVREQEMQPILKITQQGETIEDSQIYLENAQVIVKSGPLKGMEGRIKKIDRRKQRTKLSLWFMGGERCIDVSIEIVDRRENV